MSLDGRMGVQSAGTTRKGMGGGGGIRLLVYQLLNRRTDV